MYSNYTNSTNKIGLDECNGKLVETPIQDPDQYCGEILISYPNDEYVLHLSPHISSMKHHLTETHEHNFELHNIVLSSKEVENETIATPPILASDLTK